jgi:hypothetical protein
MRCERGWAAVAVVLVAACSEPAVEEESVSVPPRRAAAQESPPAPAAESGLVREVFAYDGGARDPFESLLSGATVGPELPDLTLVGVYVDHSDPERNVAVLRERVTGRRYNLRAGDRVGRLTVGEIRERDVAFIVDDFGVERRETLSIRRPEEEGTP